MPVTESPIESSIVLLERPAHAYRGTIAKKRRLVRKQDPDRWAPKNVERDIVVEKWQADRFASMLLKSAG
jgi:hypothetical protein